VQDEVMEKGGVRLDLDDSKKVQDIRKYMEDIKPEDFGKFRM
jgi:hypothetical protein